METEPELNIDFSEPKEQELLLPLEKALEYQKAGLSIIPATKNKQPPLKHWKPYQEKPASPEQLAKWFPRHQYIAIICGKVSGNIELIDFDFDESRPGIFNEWRKLVDDIDPPLRAIFGPIFFGYIGLSVSIIAAEGAAGTPEVIYLIILLGITVFAGKILGCGLGARLCKFNKKESLMIGTAMCGRGALELVLLSFGLEIGVINETHFTALVIVTLITIIFTPILYTLTGKKLERDNIQAEEIGES